ncbi:MAG: metalloregulator ArsR/SmtB family transcription factor [Desulfobulbus sp.]|nr:metalloregulator ArsR/SmtB family transcription factor [Desulfobulbus sp.]
MESEQSIAIMKALSDPSRIAIINSLLERPHYVEELAKKQALAPSTVSFHLKKLERAGLVSTSKEQYYVVIKANDVMFDITLREIVSAFTVCSELQDGRMKAYRQKVLDTFFRHGRLERLPAQHKKQLIVLERFAVQFEREHRYSEHEVTGLILPLFDDYCTIRRLLVDQGFIKREGTEYWREQGEHAASEQIIPLPIKRKRMPKNSERANIKRAYKQNAPTMGICQIRNKANGKIFIESSKNLEGTRNSRMFQLRMGKIVFNRGLQKDLIEFGVENFDFSVLATLDQPEPQENVERLLADLKLSWLEKLQPFGERGYNSAKAYQRDSKHSSKLGTNHV